MSPASRWEFVRAVDRTKERQAELMGKIAASPRVSLPVGEDRGPLIWRDVVR